MSQPQPGQGRGRARATARGKPPQQPQGRGQEPRRPGPPAGGPAAGASQAAPPKQATAAGRAGARSVVKDEKLEGLATGVSKLSVGGNGGGNGNGNGSQPLGRGAMRGRRPIGDVPSELMHTKPESLQSKKGTVGTAIKVVANYFKLTSVTNWCLYHYNVSFSHEEDRMMVKKGLIRETLRPYGGYLFDGNSLFMSVRIPTDPLVFMAKRNQDDQDIQVTVQFTNDLQPSDFHYLQVFGILVRKCLYNLKLQLIGRNYFDKDAKTDIPRFALSLWPGYATSIRQHERDILMCAEITTKVMRKDTALELAMNCQRGGNFKEAFQKAIIGSTVMTTYNDKNYKVDDVDFTVNPTKTFKKKDGSEISYLDYYKERYNVQIRDVRQPLLISRSKARDIRAGNPEFVYLIPELCQMTGLTDEMVSNIQLMRAVADITRVGPRDRINRLLALNNRLNTTPEIVNDLRQWNMSLERKLVEIDARILPSFQITAGNSVKYPSGENVDWTPSLRSNPMFVNAQISNWTVVMTDRAKQGTQAFVGMIIRAAGGMRFQVAQPNYYSLGGDRVGDYMTAIDDILSKGPCELILTIFPNNRADRYSAVKKKCYVDRAVPSQVVLEKTTQHKGAMSIATKVAIQLNCKVGGAPWVVPVPIKGLMVVGFDVCHDSGSKERSYGAMVSSLNPTFSRYYSAVSAHRDGNELSNDFALNIANGLRAYRELNNSLPERIFIYRDGVGDGQIPHVKDTELQCIKHALPQIYGNAPPPKLMFIVVTKRINTRIFTANGENPRPGTVVDDVITFPHKFDFFIVSQTVRQGTVSPTSYNVIHDESDTPPDHVQRLTYALTHVYYNFSGTVRVPAPCQYAHKLAFLVGQTLHQSPSKTMEKLLYFL